MSDMPDEQLYLENTEGSFTEIFKAERVTPALRWRPSQWGHPRQKRRQLVSLHEPPDEASQWATRSEGSQATVGHRWMGRWEDRSPGWTGRAGVTWAHQSARVGYELDLARAVPAIVATMTFILIVSLRSVIEQHQRKVKKEAQGAFLSSPAWDAHQNMRWRAFSGKGSGVCMDLATPYARKMWPRSYMTRIHLMRMSFLSKWWRWKPPPQQPGWLRDRWRKWNVALPPGEPHPQAACKLYLKCWLNIADTHKFSYSNV